MNTYVVGDIHGALKSFKQAFELCNFQLGDKMIFVGDYVDGWSESAELIEYLIEQKALHGDNMVFLRGNHDVWCQEWLNTGLAPIIWTQQGGQATLDSYVRTGHLIDKSHKDFFNNLEDWYIDEENRLFIHAGWDYKTLPRNVEELTPLEIFERQASLKVNAGTGARECHWDRSLLKNAAAIQIFHDRGNFEYNKKVKKALDTFKEIYIGHTAVREGVVQNFHNLWNVDTGCGWAGRLAIMNVDTKEVFYSDKSKELYPHEKRR